MDLEICGIVDAWQDWCVARSSASNDQLQAIINYCCGQVNCNAILPGGSCYFPNTLPNHASWALDQYYKAKGVCLKLGDVSTIAITNPCESLSLMHLHKKEKK